MTEEVEKPLESLTEEEKINVIESAVKEIDVQDILVCGKCHEVYHVLEEFKEHKENENCKGNGEIKETLKDDKKPQIWAFTLWKNTKFKNVGQDEKTPSSWNIYQMWRAMKSPEKQAWLSVATDMQGLFEIVTNFEKAKIKATKGDTEPPPEELKKAPPTVSKTPILLNTKAKNNRRAVRTGSDPNVEHLVEKILSKRYIPRRRTFEYLIKWEHFDSEKNTWEPTANLQNCKAMMEEFDKLHQLQREQLKLQKSLDKKQKTLMELSRIASEERPQRTSKQKALNQVKAWCGQEAEDYGGKRLYSDESEEEIHEKRGRYAESSSESEHDGPIVTIKRITKNGVEKRTTVGAQKVDTITLPDNILIPDAKGIVRINQKQIPSLSSGVYVMSKTAGIIKLDTAAASKLTGGGQTVLKVAPKMGSTSVKLIKKDMNNGSTITTKAGTITKTLGVRNAVGKVFVQRKPGTITAQAKKTEADFAKEFSREEEESDGVEELEFPNEIVVPTADSPPPDLTLCPLTGQLVDRDGVAVKVINDDGTMECDEVTAVSATSSNLVTLAAAEILDDLTNSEEKLDDEDEEDNKDGLAMLVSSAVSSKPVLKSKSPPPLAISASKSSTASILNTALTNANIVRRGPPKLVARNQPRPGILHSPTSRTTVQRVQSSPQILTRVVSAGTAPARMQGQMRPGTNLVRKRVVQQGPGQIGRNVVRPGRVYQQVKSSPQINTYVATPTSSTKVISMPSLVTPVAQEKASLKQVQKAETEIHIQTATTSGEPGQPSPVQEISNTISLADQDTPLLITGEDGTIYQVAGQNEEGQTILITHGDDGEQQCLLVAPENAGLISQALMKPTVQSQEQHVAEVIDQPVVQEVEAVLQQQVDAPVEEHQLTITTAMEQAVEDTTDDSQVVAQIVSANPPSPGGTRKVVLMLPDGSFMMTEVTAEQYAALELDK